jgi:uncharacterized peroxidase-related enzyme
MALIQTVAPEQASGSVAQIYQEVEAMFGMVPNAFRLMSNSPELMEQQWQHIKYYMQHPTLSFPLLATMRLLVSQEHECEYCIGMNSAMLINRAGWTPEQVAATKRNPADAPLSDKDKAMLLLVLKATKTPKAVTSQDLDGLRQLGWKDGDILDAVQHGARNISADILFNTFKIETDS